MATTVNTDELIPQRELEAVDYLIKGTETLYGNILKLVDESKKVRIGSFDDKSLNGAATAANKQKKATDELTISIAEYKRIQDDLAKTQARMNVLETEHAKQLAALKATQQDRNAQLKAEAQLQTSVNNSIDEARAKVKLLTQERNALNLKTVEGRARLKELNDEIDKNNAFIKNNVDQYTKQKINIGNYSGALTVLEAELTRVRQLMEQNTAAGNGNAEMLASLAREEALLTNLLETQITGFASATGELRNNEKALQQMAAAGMEGTAVYKQLLAETAKLKDNVLDLKAEIKNLASDTKLLDGAVGTAQAIAGAYGIAVASAQLFGAENEELQKSMVKLQAITTILIGLQQIQNALQKESSTILFINTVATKAAAAGKTLFAFATGGATVALKAFRWALIGTGIGAIIVLLGTAANAMESMADSTDKSKDAQKDHNAELEKEKQLLNDVVEASEKLRNARKGAADQLHRDINALKAKGATDKAIFDAEQTLREAELRNLKVRAASGLDVKKEILDKESEIEVAKLEFQKDQNKKSHDERKKADDKEKKRLEDAQARAERIFKSSFELEKKKVENSIKANDDIINDENASLDNRLAALSENYSLRVRLMTANAEVEKQNKNLSAEEIRLIDENLAEDLKALGVEYLNADIEIINQITAKRKDATEKEKENLKGLTDFYKKQIEERKAAEKDLQDTKIALGKQGVDAAAQLGQIVLDGELRDIDNRQASREKEKELELSRIDSLLISEQDKKDRKYRLEQEAFIQEKAIAKEREEIEKKKFLIGQGAALAKIIIDTQTAAAEIQARAAVLLATPATAALAPLALAQLPLLYGSAAISAGLIAAQVFTYAEGTEDHPGGLALVGEGKKNGNWVPEFVDMGNGNSFWVTQPTLLDMPAHSTVTPVDKMSDAMMVPRMYDAYAQLSGGNNVALLNEISGLRKDVRNMPEPSIIIDRNGIRMSVRNTNNTKNWISRNILD